MRVALCMSGQPRKLWRQFANIKKTLIDTADYVDVFAHMWYDAKEAGQMYMHGAWHDAVAGVDGGRAEMGSDRYLERLYRPVSCKVEPQIDFTSESERLLRLVKRHVVLPDWADSPRWIFCIISMMYSMKRVINLKSAYEKENSFTYDAVVRCRYDMQINRPIVYATLDLSKVNTTWCWCHEFGGVADMLAVSSSANMDVYCQVLDGFEEACQTLDDPRPNLAPPMFAWGSEVVLGHWLRAHNIESSITLDALNSR